MGAAVQKALTSYPEKAHRRTAEAPGIRTPVIASFFRQDVRQLPRMETCGDFYAALTRVLAGVRTLKQARKVRDQGAAPMRDP